MKSTEPVGRSGAAAWLAVGWASLFVMATFLHAWPATKPSLCRGPALDPGGAGSRALLRCTGAPDEAKLEGPARRLFGLPIDANRADARTLEVLPGIGPGRARAWIETRNEAPFASAEELVRIPGVGPKRAARLAPWLHFPARSTDK